MWIALLALVAAFQTQTPQTPLVQVAALTPPPRPAAAPAPQPAAAAAEAPVAEAPVAEAEPEVEQQKTRQVCRYVEVTGQRFPQRRCRTVPVD